MGLLHNLIVRIRGDSTQLDSTLQKTQSSVKGWAKKIGGYITVAFAAGVTAVTIFGKKIIGLAANAEGVITAFEKLNDPNLLNDLRKATRGTVDNVTLMQKAIQAKNFKIPLEQLATYFEFATKRAIQTKESVDYLVESIITGIGRKSVLVMDNLGISAVELQNEVKKTGDFATAAGVIIRRELESMGDVADTTATRFVRLKTSIHDFLVELGGKVIATKSFENFMKGLEKVTGLLKGKPSAFEGMSKEQLIAQKEILDKQKEQLELGREALLQEQEKLTIWGWITGKTKDYSKLLKSNTKDLEENKKQLEEIAKLLNRISSGGGGTGGGPVSGNKWGIKRGYKGITTPAPGIGKISTGVPTLAGIQPYGGTIATDAEIMQRNINALTESLYEQQIAVDLLSSSFTSLFTASEEGFKAMIDTMIDGLKRLAAELVARIAVLSLLNIITGGGASFANIFKSALGNIGFAGMASGGTVPPGYPNDSFITGLSSGEKVIPAGQAQTIKIEPKEIRVKGRDIVIALRRSGIQN